MCCQKIVIAHTREQPYHKHRGHRRDVEINCLVSQFLHYIEIVNNNGHPIHSALASKNICVVLIALQSKIVRCVLGARRVIYLR